MAQVQYLSPNDLIFLTNLISNEFKKYVKIVEGKDLSTNDFTDELKEKLEGIDLTQYSTTEEMNEAIAEAIKDISGIKFTKVDSYEDLPVTGESGVIYLVPKTESTTGDVYLEYYWETDHYELMGSTAVDLTGYLKETDLKELTQVEVKAIWDSVFGA